MKQIAGFLPKPLSFPKLEPGPRRGGRPALPGKASPSCPFPALRRHVTSLRRNAATSRPAPPPRSGLAGGGGGGRGGAAALYAGSCGPRSGQRGGKREEEEAGRSRPIRSEGAGPGLAEAGRYRISEGERRRQRRGEDRGLRRGHPGAGGGSTWAGLGAETPVCVGRWGPPGPGVGQKAGVGSGDLGLERGGGHAWVCWGLRLCQPSASTRVRACFPPPPPRKSVPCLLAVGGGEVVAAGWGGLLGCFLLRVSQAKTKLRFSQRG